MMEVFLPLLLRRPLIPFLLLPRVALVGYSVFVHFPLGIDSCYLGLPSHGRFPDIALVLSLLVPEVSLSQFTDKSFCRDILRSYQAKSVQETTCSIRQVLKSAYTIRVHSLAPLSESLSFLPVFAPRKFAALC